MLVLHVRVGPSVPTSGRGPGPPSRPVADDGVLGGYVADRPAILVEGLKKRFGETQALAGLDLEARAGAVFGLLGPNGAGKTTAVRILATLIRPDEGRAEVDGLDVVTDAGRLRHRIGLTGQYAAVDEYLTGRENVEMVGLLSRLSKRDARRRADELLERFELSEAANRIAKTYSGGMRRRLDLAASLVSSPAILFLDEPTTGLDPRARLSMWDLIRDLVAGGTTILLTTQYLEEADQLANIVAVMDRGRVIASGTPDELKGRAGGTRLEVTVAADGSVEEAVAVLARVGSDEPHIDRDGRTVSVAAPEGVGVLVNAVRDLDTASISIDDMAVRRPTLDDVFLQLTGHAAEARQAEAEDSPEPSRGGRRKGRKEVA